MRSIATATLLILQVLAAPLAADGLPDRDGYFMNEADEIRLARTAGPEGLTANASVYVLRDRGYSLVEQGDGAFHCFVERSWGAPHPENAITFDPKVRAPHCINAEGARTVMQERFRVAELALSGLGSDAINRSIETALADGELRRPTGLALTYMMSKHQWLGDKPAAWKPHVMVWMPGLTGDEVGGGNDTFLVGRPGSHRACLVVAVANFIG